MLTRLVNALDERSWQAELDELGFSLWLSFVATGRGSNLVDQGFDLAEYARRIGILTHWSIGKIRSDGVFFDTIFDPTHSYNQTMVRSIPCRSDVTE